MLLFVLFLTLFCIYLLFFVFLYIVALSGLYITKEKCILASPLRKMQCGRFGVVMDRMHIRFGEES